METRHANTTLPPLPEKLPPAAIRMNPHLPPATKIRAVVEDTEISNDEKVSQLLLVLRDEKLRMFVAMTRREEVG